MSEGDQPRVKRSRFDTSGPALPSAPVPAAMAKDASAKAKQALEKAKKLLELKQLNDKLKLKVSACFALIASCFAGRYGLWPKAIGQTPLSRLTDNYSHTS